MTRVTKPLVPGKIVLRKVILTDVKHIYMEASLVNKLGVPDEETSKKICDTLNETFRY